MPTQKVLNKIVTKKDGVSYIYKIGNVDGYLNPADGLFYEESTYETPIQGTDEMIYVDLPTNHIYRYDDLNLEFVQIGGSDDIQTVNWVEELPVAPAIENKIYGQEYLEQPSMSISNWNDFYTNQIDFLDHFTIDDTGSVIKGTIKTGHNVKIYNTSEWIEIKSFAQSDSSNTTIYFYPNADYTGSGYTAHCPVTLRWSQYEPKIYAGDAVKQELTMLNDGGGDEDIVTWVEDLPVAAKIKNNIYGVIFEAQEDIPIERGSGSAFDYFIKSNEDFMKLYFNGPFTDNNDKKYYVIRADAPIILGAVLDLSGNITEWVQIHQIHEHPDQDFTRVWFNYQDPGFTEFKLTSSSSRQDNVLHWKIYNPKFYAGNTTNQQLFLINEDFSSKNLYFGYYNSTTDHFYADASFTSSIYPENESYLYTDISTETLYRYRKTTPSPTILYYAWKERTSSDFYYTLTQIPSAGDALYSAAGVLSNYTAVSFSLSDGLIAKDDEDNTITLIPDYTANILYIYPHFVTYDYDLEYLTAADIDELMDSVAQSTWSYLAEIILDTTISTHKTWSSSKINAMLSTTLDAANEYTLEQLAHFSTASYKLASSTAEVVDRDYMYLIPISGSADGYDIYVLVDDTPTKVGTTEVNLSNYYTKTESDARFLKIVDAEANYINKLQYDREVGDVSDLVGYTATDVVGALNEINTFEDTDVDWQNEW